MASEQFVSGAQVSFVTKLCDPIAEEALLVLARLGK